MDIPSQTLGGVGGPGSCRLPHARYFSPPNINETPLLLLKMHQGMMLTAISPDILQRILPALGHGDPVMMLQPAPRFAAGAVFVNMRASVLVPQGRPVP